MIIDDNLSKNGKNVMGKLSYERLKAKNKFQMEVLVLFTNLMIMNVDSFFYKQCKLKQSNNYFLKFLKS
jgi:hypothetical protein